MKLDVYKNWLKNTQADCDNSIENAKFALEMANFIAEKKLIADFLQFQIDKANLKIEGLKK